MLGSLITAGASLLGGYLSSKSQKKQANQSAALQKEFAQQGVQWRVSDAKAAGIHPVYAMGASLPSSPGLPIMEDGTAKGIQQAGQALSQIPQARNRNKMAVIAAQSNLATQHASRVESSQRAGLLQEQMEGQRINNRQALAALEGSNDDTEINKYDAAAGTYGPYKSLYRKVWDPISKSLVRIPNTDSGVEMPESIGAYYYGKGKLQHEDQPALPGGQYIAP